MINAVLRGNGLSSNEIFDRRSPANRDDCFAPYALLKDRFLEAFVKIDTEDKANISNLKFEIHQDVQPGLVSQLSYLLMFETPFVKKENGNAAELKKYRKIFTWNDELVDGDRFIKINFPNPIHVHPVDGFENRDLFCSLIAGNKTLGTKDVRNLYPERVKSIKWYEKNAPNDFHLFGTGWDMPVLRNGSLGRLERKIHKNLGNILGSCPFPSYRGKVAQKRDVLKKTRFCICYENISDLPGYITEKIFDCFFAGCIPVYWGASNIEKYIPQDCYIDRRNFSDTSEVHSFLKTITENEYINFQSCIAKFLRSKESYQFSSEYFAEILVKTIVKDINVES